MMLNQLWPTLRATWFGLLVVAGLWLVVAHVDQVQEIILDTSDPLPGHRFLAFWVAVWVAAGVIWYFSRALLSVNFDAAQSLPGIRSGGSSLMNAASVAAVGIWLIYPRAALIGLFLVAAALVFMLWRPLRHDFREVRGEWRMLSAVVLACLALLSVILLTPSVLALVIVALVAICLLLLAHTAPTYVAMVDQPQQTANRLELWLPRILGALTFAPPAITYLGAGYWLAGAIFLISAGLFITLVVIRRQGLKAGFFNSIARSMTAPVLYSKATRMSLRTFVVMLVLLSISFGLASGLVFWGAPFARFLGSSALVYLAVACWVAFAHVVLIYPARRFRMIPPVLLLPVVAYAVGMTTRDPAVQICEAANGCVSTGAGQQREPVARHFEGWLAHRRQAIELAAAEGRQYPVVVVSAEGGGIRAAYWTAQVLTALEDLYPGFHCHVFAISGVSGGSLGASVYAALMAQDLNSNQVESCADGRAGRVADGGLAPTASKVLEGDFLAPLVAGWLFSDLIRLFVPLNWPDRGQFLEQDWEQSWRSATGDDALARDFHALWVGNGRYEVPGLVLNTTRVETGERYVISSMAFANDRFPWLADFWAQAGLTLRLSTAVHLSARFPWVSPAGYLKQLKATFVDGGYFENSGALSALELLKEVAGSTSEQVVLLPAALVIRNGNGHGEVASTGIRNSLLRELVAPLQTLLSARVTRGDYALGELEQFMNSASLENGCHIAVSLGPDVEVPFGWSLTRRAEARMDNAVALLIGGGTDAAAALRSLATAGNCSPGGN